MAFATKKLVCGLDYTLAMDLAVRRPEPSSLYTFHATTGRLAWLGIASSRLGEALSGFTEFDSIHTAPFGRPVPNLT